MVRDSRLIGQLLKEMGLVTEYEIQEGLAAKKVLAGLIGELVVMLG